MPLVRISVFLFAILLCGVSSAAETQEITGVVSLRDALAIALLQNPELEAFSWQVRAAEARLLQAGLHPNPDASLDVEDVLGSGEFNDGRQAQVTLRLGQLIELGGKRAARTDAAARARDVSSSEFEAKRVDILSEVTRRFIHLLAREREVALSQANLQLGEATLAAVRRRVSAGADSPLEQKKATTALARTHIAAEHAEHSLRVARYDLAAMWGSVAPQFERAEGDLFATHLLPTFDSLVERLAESPEVARGLTELELRRAEIKLAEAKRVPNLTVATGARWLEGPSDHAFVFGLSVPLPLTDRNQGGYAEAHALLRKSQETTNATEVRLRALIFGLHQELIHAATALELIETDILPGAEESLELSRTGFAQGRFSYLDLADAQRTLVEVEQERITTAASYHEFILEIERILGAPIEGLTSAVEAPLAVGKAGTNE